MCGREVPDPSPGPRRATLPLRPGLAERRTHDYVRHGITSLFAALDIATGKVTGRCFDRHRHGEFLAFLKLVARTYPRRELHVVLDNYGTHKHPTVAAGSCPPTHPAALHANLSELDEPGRDLLRAAHPPGHPLWQPPQRPQLVAAIHRYIDAWNTGCQPFSWVKDTDDIMIKATRNRTSGTRH